MRRAAALAGAVLLGGALPALADCADPPEPVLSLAFESRYAEGDETRSEIDPENAAEAREALEPVDDFLRDLVEEANAVLEGEDVREGADCVMRAIAGWAEADALAQLGSETAALTVGSRLAGFALVLLQVEPHASRPEEVEAVRAWLGRRLSEQMVFWEEEAPDGARRGNLRAWAALAAAATAASSGDPVQRAWAAWSTAYILCTADAQGALPQEMTRGRLALQYQFHALAPLTVSALLLDRQGVPLAGACDGALHRAAGFALAEAQSGEATRAITGEVQSFFDGSDEIEDFHLSWVEAYLALGAGPNEGAALAVAEERRPMGYSKLGGDQTLLWGPAP